MMRSTGFSENFSQLSASSELPSRTVEPSDDMETKAVEQFFCCENCGHINSKNLSSSSDISDEEYVATERHMDKRKISMCDMDIEFNPKIFKKIESLSDEQPQAKEASERISFLKSSTPNEQQRSSPLLICPVDLSKSSKNIIAPGKIEEKFITIPKAYNLKEEIISTPTNGKRRRRLHFAGDVNNETVLSPTSLKKFISSLRKTVIAQRKKIRAKGQTIRRQRKRIVTLKSLLDDLKQKKMISENASELLEVGKAI